MLLASACVPDPNGGISWYWSRTTVLVTGGHAKVMSSLMQLRSRDNLRSSCEKDSTEERGKDEQLSRISLERRCTERIMSTVEHAMLHCDASRTMCGMVADA